MLLASNPIVALLVLRQDLRIYMRLAGIKDDVRARTRRRSLHGLLRNTPQNVEEGCKETRLNWPDLAKKPSCGLRSGRAETYELDNPFCGRDLR